MNWAACVITLLAAWVLFWAIKMSWEEILSSLGCLLSGMLAVAVGVAIWLLFG